MVEIPPHQTPENALVADDDEFFRMALRSVLTGRLGIANVIECGSLDAALDALGRCESVGLALFDLLMPGMESSASLGAVRELFPATKVVVVSSSRRREDILTALEAGVHGYVPKGYRIDDLADALRSVLAGAIYVPPLLADNPSDPRIDPVERRAMPPPLTQASQIARPTLTARQWDVLELLVEGRSNKEIARTLDLGEGTVKIHLAALFRNLSVRNRSAAAVSGAALLAEQRRPERRATS